MKIRNVLGTACFAGLVYQPTAVAAADAQPLRLLLERAVSAGEGPLTVSVLVDGTDNSDIRFIPPVTLEGEIRTADEGRPVLLRLSDLQADSREAGSYARFEYLMELPEDFPRSGLFRLRLRGQSSNELPFTTPASRADGSGRTQPVSAASPPTRTSTVPVANRFIGGLRPHEPVYAVLGTQPGTNLKIQVSFKYQLFGEHSLLGNQNSWLDGFQFAFTQRMFWDVSGDSAPFRDIDFQPELLYTMKPRPLGNGRSVALQLGLRHESNGRDGDASRSLNAFYVQPAFAQSFGAYDLVISPRAWLYFGNRRGNEDVSRFRGNAGLALQLGATDGVKISSFARLNPNSGKGAIQADASYPLDRLLWKRLNLFLYGQFFSGYGEDLLDYDRKSTSARIGFAIIR